MIRGVLTVTVIAIAAPLMGLASGFNPPSMPDWKTDAKRCSWHWREGGGIGLWAETCNFDGNTWQVSWSESQAAFVTHHDGNEGEIAVQAFVLPDGSGIAALSQTLIAAGKLGADSACRWRTIALRRAPRTMAFHVLAPADPAALSPTPTGDVPLPICGPYGASTHGLRYFMTNLRRPTRAIFVEEGQERPLFDPASITSLR